MSHNEHFYAILNPKRNVALNLTSHCLVCASVDKKPGIDLRGLGKSSEMLRPFQLRSKYESTGDVDAMS